MPDLKFSTTVLCLIACVGAARAEPPPSCDGRKDRCADEIVVSAARAPRPADETGSSVSVIDRADIEAGQYAFAADAIRDAVGASLARNGGAGGFAGVRLRGAASGQSLVIIDGIVVNDAAAPQGGFNFANLDVADIERIEILRGPQGILYGADAIGGVISIVTARALESAATLHLEGGALGTFRGGATLSAGGDDRFARATVSGARNDGISRADGGAEKDGYRTIAASGKAGARLGGAWRGEISARLSRSRAEVDGFPPPAFTLGDTAETERTKDYAISAMLAHAHGGVDGAISVSWSAIDRRNEDLGFETFAAEGRRLRAAYLADVALADRFNLVAGAEFERAAARVSGVDDQRLSGAAFALLEGALGGGLHVAAGLRRDEFSDFEGATTARISVSYAIADNLRLRASWGQGFRAPSLFELHFDQFGVMPNPDLRPERAHGYDAGFEWRRGVAALSATFFETRTKDLIDFSFAQNGYYNISRARSRGVEAEAAFALGERADLSLVYTFTDAQTLASGAPLLRIPRHRAVATATVHPTPKWSLAASLAVNGREPDLPAENDSFLRLDLRSSYALSDAFEIYGRIENATDTDYQDVSGYGEPGASLYAGLRVRL